MNQALRPIAIFALAAALAAPAFAQTNAAAQDLSLSQIESRLSQQGFRVFEIERDDGHYEVKARNTAGECVELDVNRRSGEIVRTRTDDDCPVDHRSSGGR